MRSRDLLIAAGLVTAAIGIAAVLAPGIVSLSVGSLAVTALGGLMLLWAVLRVVDLDASLDQATTDDPERLRSMPRPGDDTDVRIASLDSEFGLLGGRRKAIRDRVTRAAAGALARTEGISETDARERIDEEMDATRREYEAIADLDGDGEIDETDPPPRGRGERVGAFVRRWRTGESPVQRRARRAIDAIGRRLDMPSLDVREGYPDAYDPVEDRLDAPTRDGTDVGPGPDEEWTRVDGETYRRDRRETGHWVGMTALALAFGGAGVVTGQPPLLLAAAVGIGFAAYGSPAEGADTMLDIERTIDPGTPAPDEATTVTLTIRNESGRPLPDLRIVDGVPDRLEVTSGVPRLGTTLRSGGEATLEYDVRARRGSHEFGAVTVLVRDWSGGIEDELAVDVETTLTCVPSLVRTVSPDLLRDLAVGYVGWAATDQGSGVEFDSVREYRPGDPVTRIDWNRVGRTGELTTLRFREERSTTVFILVDARAEAYLAPDDGEHAVDRALDAAGRLFATLIAASTPVGIASLGTEFAWLDAGVGERHRHRAEHLLGRDPAFGPLPPSEDVRLLPRLREIRSRLPRDAQIVFVTPLCDGSAPFVARRLDGYGHPVTVLSPDPTAGDTLGGKLVRIERYLWRLNLLGAGIPVVDWAWDQPLEDALRHATGGSGA
jgi:uncharacterized protein (DUF58 family)